jgi:hypothetical protein
MISFHLPKVLGAIFIELELKDLVPALGWYGGDEGRKEASNGKLWFYSEW